MNQKDNTKIKKKYFDNQSYNDLECLNRMKKSYSFNKK